MTSNIRAGSASDSGIGFVRECSNDEQKSIREELSHHFRPEFINRIDEIIPFSPVGINSLTVIAKKKLSELASRMHSLGYRLEISDNVAEFLAKKAESERFGVRNLIRTIIKEVEGEISDILTKSESLTDLIITLQVTDGKITAEAKENAVTN